MPDDAGLKQDLDRLADRVGESPPTFDRLIERRSHQQRSRRVGTIALAFSVAVVGIWGAFAAFDDGPGSTTPAGQRSTSWTAPDVLTIWPESVTDPNAPSVGEVQALVDEGKMEWRLKDGAVALNFIQAIFGDFTSVTPAEPVAALPGSPAGAETLMVTFTCECQPSERQLSITLVQPGRQGPTGIWSVAAVESPRLDLPASPGDLLQGLGPFPVGIQQSPSEHAAVGITSYDGCEPGFGGSIDLQGDQIFELDLHSDDVQPPGCDDYPVAYLFAYTTPQLTTQVGDPLKESASVSDLSIVPVRWDPLMRGPAPTPSVGPATAPVATGGPQGDCASGRSLSIVAEAGGWDVSCWEAPAGTPLSVQLEVRGDGLQENFAVYPLDACLAEVASGTGSHRDCVGEPPPIFRGRVVTGTGGVVDEIPPLEPGAYVFLSEVHPTTGYGTLTVS